jgi:putative DNA primase/helicase
MNTEILLTQQWNAQLLVAKYRDMMRYNATSGRWLIFDKKRWIEDRTGVVQRLAKIVARGILAFAADETLEIDPALVYRHWRDTEKASGISAMLKLAESERGIAITNEQLDANPWLQNVANGTIDLRTGESHPHRPEDLISKLAPVDYDPAAAAPLWDAFLNRVMDGNESLITYLQRIAGLCLSGDANVQELYVFYGAGANGKSVFLDTIAGMLGDYATEAPPSLITVRTHDEHPTEIADLAGRRLVVASETEAGAKLRIQLVKRLTGNARLKGRFMRQDFFEFTRTHKLILVTNNRPRIDEATNAVWRRVKLVPFNVIIPEAERDTQLLDKLRGEWPGILAWAVRGCLDYQRNGMQTPDEVTAATEEYRAEQDRLSEWLEQRCIVDPDGFVTRSESFADYIEWSKQAGERDALDRNTFYEHLRRLDGVTEAFSKAGGRTARVFKGIALADLGKQYAHASERVASL